MVSIDISWHRSCEAAKVAWTTSTTKPFRAYYVASCYSRLAIALQRIRIEEMVARKAATRNQTIIKSTLYHIIVFSLAMEQEHTPIPIYISNGSTCFAVSLAVRQFIVYIKSLTINLGTNTTSDIVFLFYHIVPNLVDSIKIRLIAHDGSDISHTRIHICSTYSMSHSLILHYHRFVGLAILFTHYTLQSAKIEEIFSKLQIFFVACNTIHLYQAHFHNLVSWLVGQTTFKEIFHQQVCILNSDIKQ